MILDNGLITEDEAVELLTNLWIKTLTINKVRSQAHTFSSAGSPMYQNVTIGGQTPDKKDAVNKLIIFSFEISCSNKIATT